MQKNDGIRGGLGSHLVVLLEVDAGVHLQSLMGGRLGHHGEDMVAAGVQGGVGDDARLIGPQHVGGVGLVPGHIHVVARAHLVGHRAHRAPVGHNEALKAELTAKNIGEKLPLNRGVIPVEAVVGGHDGQGGGIRHYHTEGLEVDLPQGTLGDVGGGRAAGGLLVVGGEVLDTSPRPRGLHTPDVGGGHDPRQNGILGAVFKVTPAQDVLLDVHAGAQDDVDAQRQRVLTDGLSHGRDQRGIPGGGEVMHRGIPHRGAVAHTRRAVIDGDGGDTQAVDGVGTARSPRLHGILHARDHVGLLLGGHGGHHTADTVQSQLGQTVLHHQGHLVQHLSVRSGNATHNGEFTVQLIGGAVQNSGMRPVGGEGYVGDSSVLVGQGELHGTRQPLLLDLGGHGQGNFAVTRRQRMGDQIDLIPQSGGGRLLLGLGVGGLGIGGVGSLLGIRRIGGCLGGRRIVCSLIGKILPAAGRCEKQNGDEYGQKQQDFFHDRNSFS